MQFKEVLDDINENHLTIDCCVLDNLKRAILRCGKNHAGKFACEYCFNAAVVYVDLKKKALASIEKRYKEKENALSQQLSQLPETEESDSENEETQNLRDQLNALAQEKDLEIKKKWEKTTYMASFNNDGKFT